jgi:hypothetical protein
MSTRPGIGRALRGILANCAHRRALENSVVVDVGIAENGGGVARILHRLVQAGSLRLSHLASGEAASTGRTHGCTDQCCVREESPCQLRAVHTWPEADVHEPTINVCFRGIGRHRELRLPYPAATPMGGAAADEVRLGI